MKKSVLSNMKIWVTVLLSLLLVGMVLFGVFGFNKSIDYKEGYEVQVSANDILDDSVSIMKNATEKYFSDNGLKPVNSSSQTLNGGETLVYKFDKDVSEHIDGLKTDVQAALDSKGITVEVNAFETIKKYDSYAGYSILAGCIVLAIAFIYNTIADKMKIANALTIVAAAMVSILLYMALVAIIRVSFAPFGVAMGVLSGLLTLVYSTGILAKCKEAVNKGVKKTNFEIGEDAVKNSALRLCVIECTIIIVALITIIFGSAVVASSGILALIASASATFVSAIFVGPLWATLSGKKPDKNRPAEKQEDKSQE